MPKYKVLIKNTLEIGRFKSVDGVLEVESPTEKESKKIDNAIANGIIEKAETQTKTVKKTKEA
jgi:hypothetical protein